jgi:phytanoyl-CoA hydroxylase
MRRALHPWNTGFVWSDHAGRHATVSAGQARDFDELGYFVIEDAFDGSTLAHLDAELAPGDEKARQFLAGVPEGRFGVTGLDSQTVAPHAVTRSELIRRFVAADLFVGLARDLIGPDVRLYWDQSVFKQPAGAEPVLWHQDNGYTYVEPQAYLTCWVALTDATLDNGCVQVLPGVHRRGTVAHVDTPIGYECCRDPQGAVAVPVKAGSIVVFSSLTPHATGHNTTDAVRKAYIVQYAPDGAVALQGDPAGGSPTGRIPQNHPRRQFPVVVGGEPVSAVALD